MKHTLLLLTFMIFIAEAGNAQTKNVYASATTGGAYGFGTIIKGDSNAQNFTVVHSFDSLNGSYPIGRMVLAKNGDVYCVTELGGCDDSCTLGKFDPATGTYTMIYQFFLNISQGGVPYAGLTLGDNGLIYGTTTGGGIYYDSVTNLPGGGVIYTIDPTTDTYTDVYNFADSVGPGPLCELLQGNDGMLYGLTTQYNDTGYNTVLFKFNPTYNQLTPLSSVGYSSSPNYAPVPSLVQGPGNKLYGIYAGEGSAGEGTAAGLLFSYDLSNGVFADLHDFTDDEGVPIGGLLLNNGIIYGSTSQGSTNPYGLIYSYSIANAVFTGLAPFDITISGYNPMGSPGMFGNDQLIGSTSSGGGNGVGALFTFNLSSNTFTNLLNFDMATTGAGPQCDVLLAGFQPTGINDVTVAQPSVYPNPASKALYVQNARANAPYTVTNVLGQVIDAGIFTGALQQIDVQQLPSGMYFINNVKFVKL